MRCHYQVEQVVQQVPYGHAWRAGFGIKPVSVSISVGVKSSKATT
jgi:hypothetical protein